MYTLSNGTKVKDLTFEQTVDESWEKSQYFWYGGRKVCEMFNTETGEVKWVDYRGKEIVMF